MKKNWVGRKSSLWIFKRKTFFEMKITLLFVFCSLLQVEAGVLAQKKVSMQLKEVTLDKVFKELSRQVNCDFLYNHSLIKQKGNVSVNVKDEDLSDLLDALLPRFGMEYIVDENVIVIREKLQQSQEQKEIEIKGIVVDKKGMALPGVTVRIKGTNWGTATDENGKFNLRLPDQQDIILAFSFVGMKAEELPFVGQKEIRIVMYEDKHEIEEVVVTGYQVLDKRTLTSSISTIKAEELEKMGTLTVDQMLEGKVPGLMITNLSATPGAAAKVRVRASGTFTGSREPLWVIDGVVYEDPVPLSAAEINSFDNVNLIGNAITGLNPQDIESISVLKDASATAIYGTRAANGVIVITTRRGKEGSARVSYAGSFNIVDRPRYSDFNLMTSKERIDVSREIYERGLVYPTIWPGNSTLQTPLAYEKALLDYWKTGSHEQFQKEVSRLEALNYDWFKELYRPALNHSHSVNVSGGSEMMRFYFSLGYDKQLGTEKGVGLDRITARTNLDINLRKNVLLTFGIDGSVQKADYNHEDLNVFNEAYYTSRAVGARDENGDLLYINKLVLQQDNAGFENEFGRYNIIHERDHSGRKITNKAFNFNVGIDWEIIKGVKLNSRFSYRNTSNLTEQWMEEDTYYMAQLRGYDEWREDLDENVIRKYSLVPFGGLYGASSLSQEALSIRNQLNFLKVLADKHVFNLNITQEASSTKYGGSENWEALGYNHEQGRGFISLPSVSLGYEENGEYQYQNVLNWFSNAKGHSVYPSITEKTTNLMSWLGIFTYSYDDRYIANFNIRSDGSNAFGQYERYKFRPSWSASLRWNVHNELFLKGVESVNELALRLSYGFRGAAPNASPYLVLSDYGRSSYYYPENTASLSSFPNGNLRWEKTATLNGGIDFSFLGNRLSGSLDYAYSKSTDLLLSRPVSLVNGISSQLYNGGSKNDHTLEFNARGELLKIRDFRWNVNFNITKMTENIIEGTNVETGSISIRNYLDGEILLKDFPIDGFFSYRFGGLDESGVPIFTDLYEEFDTQYEKLQHILVYEGSRIPKFYGGFGTEFNYKRFTFSANFSYKVGHKVRLLELYNNGTYLPLSNENMRNEFVDRWRKPGDELLTNIPVLSADSWLVDTKKISTTLLVDGSSTSLYNLYDLSDLRTAKADFIRCQSLTLSYRCPERFLEKIGLQALILRMQVQNPVCWTFDKKLEGQDPEQVRNLGLPTLPSYNLGLNISF